MQALNTAIGTLYEWRDFDKLSPKQQSIVRDTVKDPSIQINPGQRASLSLSTLWMPAELAQQWAHRYPEEVLRIVFETSQRTGYQGTLVSLLTHLGLANPAPEHYEIVAKSLEDFTQWGNQYLEILRYQQTRGVSPDQPIVSIQAQLNEAKALAITYAKAKIAACSKQAHK